MLSPDDKPGELETTQVIVREELGLDTRAEKFKVLLADDEPDALTLFRAILDQFNYDLLLAEDGVQALELFHQLQPDLVILDWQMPNMNGLEVCKKIKDATADKYFLPVLIVTSQADPYAKVEGLRSGADDYITKPFFCEELQIKVASFLRIKKTTDELIRSQRELEDRELKLTKRLYDLDK